MRVTYKRISRIRALRLAAGVLSTELSVHDRGMIHPDVQAAATRTGYRFPAVRAGRFRRLGAGEGAACRFGPGGPGMASLSKQGKWIRFALRSI